MSDFEMEAYCPNCKTQTNQLFHDAGHERDSSSDTQECTVCHWLYLGWTGRWYAPSKLEEK